MENVFRINELRYVPRWLVFFIDISIVSFSSLVLHLFLQNLDVAINFSEYQNQKIFLVIAVNILFMLVFKTYAGIIIRYSTFFDYSIVCHATAYKYVPLIEDNPHESIFENVAGVRNLALLSKKYIVNRFVMVSTDKAVNPTNVIGASKRTAEFFIQSLQNSYGNKTKFITTRFGNVLGSNSLVIPHLSKQIAKGAPVTITHPDIIRYFITIPEVCELVFQAGAMGEGDEIYVLDIGKPIKILDLAKKMIKLSEYTPDIDKKIDFIGLRPGEKLYEELLTNHSTTVPTHHEKIMMSKDPLMEFDDIEFLCKQIIRSAIKKDGLQVVKLLKTIVHEFISNNSQFEILDKISEHKV